MSATPNAHWLALLKPEAQQLLQALGPQPEQQATELLKQLRASLPAPVAAAACTSLLNQYRYRRKLPAWSLPGMLLPSQAAEQATPEALAHHRMAVLAEHVGGGAYLDLTAGLGSDALAAAGCFASWTAVETNPVLADLLAHNASVRGLPAAARLYNTSAEDFLALNPSEQPATSPPYTLVFVDPDRRAGRARLAALHQLAPNILALKPQLRSWGRWVYIKLSPLYSPQELERLFPEGEVWVWSLDGEVKETGLLLGPTPSPSASKRRAWVLTRRSDWHNPQALPASPEPATVKAHAWLAADLPPGWRPHCWPDYTPLQFTRHTPWVVAPDTALLHANLWPLAEAAAQRLAPGATAVWTHPAGYLLCSHKPPEMGWGRVYALRAVLPPAPKALKSELAAWGIGGASIQARGLPLKPPELARKLKLKSSERWSLLFVPKAERQQAVGAVLLVERQRPEGEPSPRAVGGPKEAGG